MPDITYQRELLRDPLSEETRKERRNLLGVGALGIIMVKTGLIPTKISALGIEFSQADRNMLLYALAVITMYFLLAFIFYSLADYSSYRMGAYVSGLKYQQRRIELLQTTTKHIADEAKAYEEVNEELRKVNKEFEQVNKEMESHTTLLKKILEDRASASGIDGALESRESEFKNRSAALHSRRNGIEKRMSEVESQKKETLEYEAELHDIVAFAKRASAIAALRLFFEFAVPISVGIYAVVILFRGQ